MKSEDKQLNFPPDVLLVFVGHSDDAAEEAKAVRDLEQELQRELERLLDVPGAHSSFKRIRVWEWTYDASSSVGGQEKVINPNLQRANIAVFVFKERVGKITWIELQECRERNINPIPLIPVFPKNPPDASRMSNDINTVANWLDLLSKKKELTADWNEPNSKSVTPQKDYDDIADLKKTVSNEIKEALPIVLKSNRPSKEATKIIKDKLKAQPDYSHLTYDRRPMIGYTLDQLDGRGIEDFLSKPLSQEEAKRAGVAQSNIDEYLHLLGCLHADEPTLGAFLCFAPSLLLSTWGDACSLHLVAYDKTIRAESLPDITPVHDNLINLFEAGMDWLKNRSGLRKFGVVGSPQRDDLEIPEIALREAFANALVHRDYEHPSLKEQPTRIEVYEDRLVITSFGKLDDRVSLKQLNKDPEKVTAIRRNPVLARIFNYMGFVEHNASGVSRMHRATLKVSLPPPKIIAKDDIVCVEFSRLSPSDVQNLLSTTSRGNPPSTIPKVKPFSIPSGKSLQSKVIISIATRDLPLHRKEIMDACLRQGMFPLMMEHLPASDAEAISASLKLVDEADIYIGIFAHRYGYVPQENNPQHISITEMEYNRAVERNIPRLIFIIDKNHALGDFTINDIDTGENASKLAEFKSRIETENIVNFFQSPADLRAHVINSLSKLREPDLSTFHYISDIPEPPEAFIAHPYTLLQTHRLVGRQPELNLLTDWVAKAAAITYRAHILNVVAVGGLGKSALTWKWFNDIAPQEMSPLAGRLWWSFYESDATFENFVTRALAYVTRRPLAEVQQIPAPERETQLLAALDREPFLLVLDGLERILIAYARMDAAHLSDDDYDKRTANFVANAIGLPASAAQSFTGEHRLRKTADPRAASFLRKLATVRASRILVSTRLYPADLQTVTGEPLGSCAAKFLSGLADDDALELWRAFGATGARDSLLPLFQRADNHPLLIQALASEVARYRPAPGDFDAWRRAHPDFDPFGLPLVQVKSHVLAFALRGLDDKAQQVLRTIAAFRMPARYDTLAALLIGEGKPCADERELDEVLTELEDRGLVGWDKRANRHDLHPLVRGVVWSSLGDDTRRGVYRSLHAHFEALPKIDDWKEVKSLEDLTPAMELYNTLIGLERYDAAEDLFIKQLDKATLYRLSASRQRIELLEMLFPEGLEQLPRLSKPKDQAFTLNALALGYQFSGQPGRASSLLSRSNTIYSGMKREDDLSVGLCNLSDTSRVSGALFESEVAALSALLITQEQQARSQEAVSLYWIGLTLVARGIANESQSALQRSLRICIAKSKSQLEGVVNSHLAQRSLWLSKFAAALSFADRAWELAHLLNHEGDFIRAARRQGEAALGLNDLATADERLHHALTRARMVNLVEEELPALVALAELRRQQGEGAAREFLDDVWDAAERGPYPLIHADACNVLAQVERDAGNVEAAVKAATQAYRLAWCDGPPFAYHWGLEKAREHLRELGVKPPEMPPFDESKFEPMPEVEIDPEDEFHAGKDSDV